MRVLSTKPTSVKSWLSQATKQLSDSGIEPARLDAELLLAHVLGQTRTWLHAHPDYKIGPIYSRRGARFLKKRTRHVPLAYLTGQKEFYGRAFRVNRTTLVPRPESEDMIELLKQLARPGYKSLVDVGTGSGCLGISAKLEFPELKVTLVDISQPALKVAKANANRLAARVTTKAGDLLTKYGGTVDIVLANLPYVSRDWTVSPATKYEPSSALFASLGGLELIYQLLDQTNEKLSDGGLIILEADPAQHTAITDHASHLGLKKVASLGYQIAFIKG